MPSGAAAAVTPQDAKKSSFRPDIQGLRAVAVLAVIADHLFHWPSGGFVGVDVFFVISGFLITGLLLREYERTGHISFRGFYNRRVRRIIPAATLVLVVTVLASYFLLAQARFLETAADAFWAFIFVGNWHMALVGTDYFQLGLPPSPVQHYWSLSVEEQFYFVWPWITLGILVAAAKLKWNVSARWRAVSVFFVVATVASFVWSVVETANDATFAYFSTFSRAWELGIGALLAAAVPLLSRIPRMLRPWLGGLGLGGIAVSIFTITAEMAFPGPWAALPVLSTAMVIAAGTGVRAPEYDRVMLPLTNPVSRYIGDISYSLYLWHFPVIVLMLALLPASSPLYVAICLVAMAGLAMLSYHFVENAFRVRSDEDRAKARRNRRRRRRRGRSATISRNQWVTLMAVGVATIALVAIALIPRVPTPFDASTTSSDRPVVAEEAADVCRGADFMAESKADDCDPAALGDQLFPGLNAVADDTGGAYRCYRPQGGELEMCNYGSAEDGATRVALIGDSHAAMLLPGLIPELEGLNWSLDTYVGNGCQWKARLSSDCEQAMEQIRATIASEPYDVILTTGARWVGGNRAAAAESYASAWEEAASVGSRVIAIADVPGLGEEALACIARVGFNPADHACGTPRADALAESDPLLAAAAQADVPVVDMTDFFCDDSFCPSVIGNTQVYRDTAAHVTASYMESLAPYLSERIAGAIG